MSAPPPAQSPSPLVAGAESRRAVLPDLPAPEPMPDVAAYHRERDMALAMDARKRENWERYRRARRGETMDFLPIRLDIENVSRCNFSCIMCQVSSFPRKGRAADMTLDDFKRLIDEQYGLVEIKLQGMGEPLLAADEYFAMIRYARERHIWVRAATNGSLLHLHDNARRLVEADPNEIQISIDGADKKTFESIRHGSRFDMVVQNSRLINRYCNERNIQRVKMFTVAQKANRHQLADIVRLGADIGFRKMVLMTNICGYSRQDWTERNNAISVENDFTVDDGWRLHELGRSLGLEIGFWHINAKFETGSPDKLCPWPFERGFVSSDMRLVPCCMISNPETSDMGDARDLTRTWNDVALRDFRRAHLEGRVPEICRSCYK